MAHAVNRTSIFKYNPSRYTALNIFCFTFLCAFAFIFLFSQSISVWQSTQAKQVQAEAFKIERESVRKEFAKDTFDFTSFLFSVFRMDLSMPLRFSLLPLDEVTSHLVPHLEIIPGREQSPRAPPYSRLF